MNKEFAEREANAMAEQKVFNIIMSQYVKENDAAEWVYVPILPNDEKFNHVVLTIGDTLVELEKKNGEPQKYVMTTISGKPHIAFKKTEELYHLINEIGFVSYMMLVRSEFNRVFEHFQVYENLNQSEKATTECKVQCLVYALKECGVPQKVCHQIANFTDNRRFNGITVFSDIAENFNLRIRFKYFDEKGELRIGNHQNGGWYGKIQNKHTITCELAEFENHMFINKPIPMTKFYLNNKMRILVYGFQHGWTAQQCFQATKFIGNKCYSDKNAKTEPIYLFREMIESYNHREEIQKHNEEVIRKFKEDSEKERKEKLKQNLEN